MHRIPSKCKIDNHNIHVWHTRIWFVCYSDFLLIVVNASVFAYRYAEQGFSRVKVCEKAKNADFKQHMYFASIVIHIEKLFSSISTKIFIVVVKMTHLHLTVEYVTIYVL